MTRAASWIACALAALAPLTVRADPRFRVVPATTTAEKGHTFEIALVISTDVALENLRIVATPPENFCIEPRDLSGLIGVTRGKEASILVAAMPAGSSLTIPYRVATPSQFMLFEGACDPNAKRTLDTTSELKPFVFNAAFRLTSDSTPVDHYWSETLQVKYTTSHAIYLLGGALGLIVGFIVKSLLRADSNLPAQLKGLDTTRGKMKAIGSYLAADQLPFFITTLLIGFGALLGLAKNGIPVGGVWTAIVLGIGIGVASDDKILATIKPVPSAGERGK